MNYNMNETMAFTGHRSIAPSKAGQIRQNVRKQIKDLYIKGIRFYLCGMALGFDMLAAEEVLALKETLPSLKLLAVVPFTNQSNRWNHRDQERYRKILESADETIVLSDVYFSGCYLARNDYMISHSAGVVAYFDGTPKGGTFYTIRKARAKGKNILNLFT